MTQASDLGIGFLWLVCEWTKGDIASIQLSLFLTAQKQGGLTSQ